MRKSKEIALCGLLGALIETLLLLGNILPLATFCAPLLAGCLLCPVLEEKSSRTAWLLYAATALLALMLPVDPELSFCYVFVAGPYPMLRIHLNRLRFFPLRLAGKVGVFCAAVGVMYGLLFLLFPAGAAVAELRGSGAVLLAATAALGLVAFLAYDRMLDAARRFYVMRLRPSVRRFL